MKFYTIAQFICASNPDRLLAEWTAPGGDYDVGSVASYRFVFSQNIEDLIDPIKGEPQVLLGFDRIERAGTVAKFDFNFPHYDQDFYVGAYGFDMAGNRGKISNLVHVRVSSPTSVYDRGHHSIQSDSSTLVPCCHSPMLLENGAVAPPFGLPNHHLQVLHSPRMWCYFSVAYSGYFIYYLLHLCLKKAYANHGLNF